ncbi:nucleotidyltransferase family protein [Methylomonas sp. MgM2]
MSPVIGVLLAAGSSKRFGSDKLMLSMPDGISVAARACRNLLEGVDRVLVVVRPGSDRLVDHLVAEGADVRTCIHAGQGMGTSLAFGIGVCPEAAGWLIALADMPWISPVTIRKIAEAISSGALVAAPVWQERRGHPVGFSWVLRDELIGLSGDVGAKSVIQSNINQLRLVECDDPGILTDIDYPDDLRYLNEKRNL